MKRAPLGPVSFPVQGGWPNPPVRQIAQQLRVDGEEQGSARSPASPPAFFSIDETFDVGVDTGSPAGNYPASAAIGYPLPVGLLKRVDFELL